MAPPRQTVFARGSFARGGKDTGREIALSITNILKDLGGEALKSALTEMAKEIIEQTDPLVPVEDGSLINSAKFEIIDDPKGPKVEIKYGGTTTQPGRNAPDGIVDYAVIVHEDLTKTHPHGQAKFLEQGARNAQSKLIEIAARHLRSRIK